MNNAKTFFVCCILLATVVLSGGCAKKKFKHTFMRMDTVVDVTLVSDARKKAQATWPRIDSLLLYFENHFSPEHDSSEVRAINYRAHDTVTVSPLLMDMVVRSCALAETLSGYFDITIYPIKTLWGLSSASKEHRVPSTAELQATLGRIGFRKVLPHPEDHTLVFTDSRVAIDVGGIAKSEALWATAAMLDKAGFTDYLISAGGDILCRGKRDDGKPWHIGVQHPRIPGKLLATVDLDSGSIVTSGDYERFWLTPDSLRVHHIFDPYTGESCRRNQSVTVWCKNPKRAYVPSVGLFCRDPQDIVAFCEARNDNFECVVVDSTGGVFMSKGWKDKIQIEQ